MWAPCRDLGCAPHCPPLYPCANSACFCIQINEVGELTIIWDQNNLYAIIVDEEVIVYSAPFLNQAIEQSVFYRGNKVKIHQKTDVWIEVSTFDGRKGWIRAQDVRNLY